MAGIKIRDNETGEIFEYGENNHHALRISPNGGCLTFENMQNGDGSLPDGRGGYSFVLEDGKTPNESESLDAIQGASYANVGGFEPESLEKIKEEMEKVLMELREYRKIGTVEEVRNQKHNLAQAYRIISDLQSK